MEISTKNTEIFLIILIKFNDYNYKPLEKIFD